MENEQTNQVLPKGAIELLDYLIKTHPRQIAEMYGKENCVDDLKDVYAYFGFSDETLDSIWSKSEEESAVDNDELEAILRFCKKGRLIYPKVVARYLDMPIEKAYRAMDDYAKRYGCMVKRYQMQCPVCGRSLWIFHSVADIDDNMKCYCDYCDNPFIPRIFDDVQVVYEKL